MSMLWRAGLALILFAGGCSWTFDGDASEIPLIGSAPDTEGQPHLNVAPAQSSVEIVYGADGRPWAIFDEALTTDGGDAKQGMRAVRVNPPGLQETLFADNGVFGDGHFYLLRDDPADAPDAAVHLTIQALPRDGHDAEFTLPLGPGLLLAGPGDQVFVYQVESPMTTTFLVQRVDKSFSRMIPILPGTDPSNPLQEGGMFFSVDGNFLFTQDATGDLVKHSTTSEADVDLGIQPAQMALDVGLGRFMTCGPMGLRSVPIDGSPESTLDPSPCDQTEPIYFRGGDVLYTVSGTLRRTARNGSTPPTTVLEDGQRLIAFGPAGALAYSRDPQGRYAAGAGDGWLSDWRFMERGRGAGWSRDGKKLRWLEHAAQESGVGELLSATVPNGAPLHLALNVRQYDELSDGRVLACDDRAFRGIQNRVVVIDEQARTARWVASQAAEYVHIPGSSDLLIDVVSGPSTYDIVRVPVPPR